MFEKSLIPEQNPQVNQYLSNLYNRTEIASEQRSVIDKKVDKVDNILKNKIVNTLAISQYFDNLWKQSDLNEKDKEYTIKKLEAIQKITTLYIKDGYVKIAKTRHDLDVVNAKFKAFPFEEFTHEKILKAIKKKINLDIESDLFANSARDLDLLYALNRSNRLEVEDRDYLHYTAGLYEPPASDEELVKQAKAEEFVKKIQEEKKAFNQKLKQIEQNLENKDKEEFEMFKKRELEEEENRQKEKKKRLEAHIKELKAKSEARVKEKARWEDEYKLYLNKKPLYKEYENKFQQGYMVPELEERKRKLQEIRDFHRPISKQDLVEHEQKVLKILDQRQQEKKENMENSSWVYKKPEYESRHHRAFAEELTRQRNQKEDFQMALVKRKEKVMDLLQEVKDKHLPRVDPQKEMEIINIVDKLKKRKDGRSRTADVDFRDGPDAKKLGVEYLKSVRVLVEKIKKENPNISKMKDGDYSTAGKRSESYISTDKRGVMHSTKSEVNLRKHNYLADLRKENKLQGSTNQVDIIIKNKKLDQKEKHELLKTEINKLEEKAKRKEMVKKYKLRNFEGVSDDDDVDQIYINAIRAKLEMLGN